MDQIRRNRAKGHARPQSPTCWHTGAMASFESIVALSPPPAENYPLILARFAANLPRTSSGAGTVGIYASKRTAGRHTLDRFLANLNAPSGSRCASHVQRHLRSARVSIPNTGLKTRL